MYEMLKEICTYFLVFFGAVSNYALPFQACNFELVSREEWGARPPEFIEPLQNPVPYVIIHHSYQPPACYSTDECIKAMQWMQDLHQIQNKWNDIGYNFAVGGDGKVYVGRGWSAVGAHSPIYNNQSIGIVLIGDWRYEIPSKQHLETVHKLIKCGVEIGKISCDYQLFGHKQVRMGTECPGDRLFQEITTWKHFSTDPPFVFIPKVLPK